MLIDEAITAQCKLEAAQYRQYEIENPTARPASAHGRRANSPRTPSPHRSILPMLLPGVGSYTSSGADQGAMTSASSEKTEISEGDEDMYVLSPTATASNSLSPASPQFRNVWTHANMPRSTPRVDDDEEVHSPKSVMKALRDNKAKRQFADFEEMGPGFALGSAYSSPGQSPKRGKFGWSKALVLRMEGQGDGDGGYEADSDEMEIDGGCGKRGKGRSKEFGEFQAARTLVNMKDGKKKAVARRASA